MAAGGTLSMSVVVPTYLRPTYLVECLRGLLAQTLRPDEVVVVRRDTDEATAQALRELDRASTGTPIIRTVSVATPGFLPPIAAGIAAARGDVVAFTDDDAVPYVDWLERILPHYADPTVGGVGGRCVNIEGGAEVVYPVAADVGRFRWFGRVVGNMYRDTGNDTPRPVHFFMGGNMSYRATVLKAVSVDFALNENVAFNYEVDLGLQVRSLGFQLVYDPMAKIRHFSAPRPEAGVRTRNVEAIYWYSHNLLYITLKHQHSPTRRWLAIVFSFLVGDRMGWGVMTAVLEYLRRRRLDWFHEIVAAFSGKRRALRTYRAWRP